MPLDEDNLVWRAAGMLWKALGFGGKVRDVTVRIEKAIPLQSGLGGGSSDAAAALVALGRLWAGQPPIASLRELGTQLGADVAFFLTGGTALGLGAGEEIYPLVDLPSHWIVLVIPPFGVSTREAYGWYDEERAAGYAQGRELQVLPIPWPSRAAQMINDLEPSIARRHPEITETRTALRETGAIATAMSGSGSAVFGLFRDRRTAAAAVPRLSRDGWSVHLTRTVDRAEYRAALAAGARSLTADSATTDFADHGPRITRITRIRSRISLKIGPAETIACLFPPARASVRYGILSAIGAGGMGEVYRARDSRLNRDVAIKVLPDLFVGDVDRLARFRREAQVLASLNHSNIAQIYGFEDSDGVAGARDGAGRRTDARGSARRADPSRSTRGCRSRSRSLRRSKPRTSRASSTVI